MKKEFQEHTLDNGHHGSLGRRASDGGREAINKTDGKSPIRTIAIQAQVAQGWITNINSGIRFRINAS